MRAPPFIRRPEHRRIDVTPPGASIQHFFAQSPSRSEALGQRRPPRARPSPASSSGHVEDRPVETGVEERLHRIADSSAVPQVSIDGKHRVIIDAARPLDSSRRATPSSLVAVTTSVPRRVFTISAGSRRRRGSSPARDLDLVPDRGRIAEAVPHVGVLRHEPERLLLAAAPDQDLRSPRLHRLRIVVRAVDVVALPLERRSSVG